MEEIRIGKIVSVKGTKIISKLDELLPPYLVEKGEISQAPKINTYVKSIILSIIFFLWYNQYCSKYKIKLRN